MGQVFVDARQPIRHVGVQIDPPGGDKQLGRVHNPRGRADDGSDRAHPTAANPDVRGPLSILGRIEDAPPRISRS